MTKTIEFPDLISALEAMGVEGDEGDKGMTSAEISEALGMNNKKTVEVIKQGLKDGKLRIGRRTVFKDWDGKKRHYQVYCLVREEG